MNDILRNIKTNEIYYIIEDFNYKSLDYQYIVLSTKGIMFITNTKIKEYEIIENVKDIYSVLNMNTSYVEEKKKTKDLTLTTYVSKCFIYRVDNIISERLISVDGVNEVEEYEELIYYSIGNSTYKIIDLEKEINAYFSKKDVLPAELLDDYYNCLLNFDKTEIKDNDDIKKTINGELLIKINEEWFPATEESSEYNFKEVLFKGLLGIDKLYERKYYNFILYFLTGGLFYLGWLADILPFFFNRKRDKEGRYYLPLDKDYLILNKPLIIAMFIINLVISITMILLTFFLPTIINMIGGQ